MVNIKKLLKISWCYGQNCLKAPLREIIDCPTAKQSYNEAIGYAIQDISDRFEQLYLDGRLV